MLTWRGICKWKGGHGRRGIIEAENQSSLPRGARRCYTSMCLTAAFHRRQSNKTILGPNVQSINPTSNRTLQWNRSIEQQIQEQPRYQDRVAQQKRDDSARSMIVCNSVCKQDTASQNQRRRSTPLLSHSPRSQALQTATYSSAPASRMLWQKRKEQTGPSIVTLENPPPGLRYAKRAERSPKGSG
jgi:hypothetical protein